MRVFAVWNGVSAVGMGQNVGTADGGDGLVIRDVDSVMGRCIRSWGWRVEKAGV